jgi:hypothetical protein
MLEFAVMQRLSEVDSEALALYKLKYPFKLRTVKGGS